MKKLLTILIFAIFAGLLPAADKVAEQIMKSYEDGSAKKEDTISKLKMRKDALAKAGKAEEVKEVDSMIAELVGDENVNAPQPAQELTMSFDGKNDYVSLKEKKPFKVDSLVTAECWVKSAGKAGALIARYGGGCGYEGFVLQLSGGFAEFRVSNPVQKKQWTAKSDIKIIPDEWTHLAGTFSKDGTVTIYVNGKKSGEEKGASLKNPNGAESVTISKASWCDGCYFQGSIANVGVYEKVKYDKDFTPSMTLEKTHQFSPYCIIVKTDKGIKDLCGNKVQLFGALKEK